MTTPRTVRKSDCERTRLKISWTTWLSSPWWSGTERNQPSPMSCGVCALPGAWAPSGAVKIVAARMKRFIVKVEARW